MRRKDPKLELLRGVPGLAGCRDSQLQPLLRQLEEVGVAAGHVLAREGVPTEEVFVIVDGTAVVTLRGERLATLGPGQFVGPRSATVTASSDMRLLAMGPGSFASLLHNGRAAQGMARGLVGRLREI